MTEPFAKVAGMKHPIGSRRWSAVLSALLWLALASGTALLAAEPPAPWLFFDLGENSLVATPEDPRTGDIASLSWIRYAGDSGKVTNAHEYLKSLRSRGYPIGLIVNIPAEWGDPQLKQGNSWLAESDPATKEQAALALTAAKLEAINDYFEGRGPEDGPGQKRRWNDPAYPSMDFALFTRGAVFAPFFARFRKPMDGPTRSPDQLYLYRRAVELASRLGGRAIYQGTNSNDLAAAEEAGMLVRQLPYDAGRKVQAKGYYLDGPELDRMTRP